jgi:integrase/recombinase XerC
MAPANKGKKYPADPLTTDEVRRMLEVRSGGEWMTRRAQAVVALLWRCGLRVNELAQLDVDDVRDTTRPSIRARTPKGSGRGKPPREIGLDDKTLHYVRRWLAVRASGSPHRDPALFVSSNGRRLDTSYIRKLVKKLARTAGIDRRVHPHALRHAFARSLYDEQIGIVHIQRALGHENLNTTARYLSSIGADDVVDITGAREW